VKQRHCSGVLFVSAAIAILGAQPVWAAVTQVIGVRLNPTAGGLNLVMETSTGARPQIFTGTRGKVLVEDIVNTQLRLPQGNSFRSLNPAPGINSVEITQLDANTIRIFVIGTLLAPSGKIAQRSAQGITLSFSPGSGTAAASAPATPSTLTAPPNSSARPQIAQSQSTPVPSVMVPNPQLTIDGKPAQSGAGTAQAASPAQPFLPRAIAPPVGDIAVSNSDASPALIDLGTTERVPRLVLRDAPAREVLALLARAAGLNLVFTPTNTAAGEPGQPAINAASGAGNTEGPTISLDIENESVQDVFNYVLRISGLQANRNGKTILVGTTLPNQARNVIVRSFRLNQVTVGVALNFLVGFGAESAVSRERVITSVTAVPLAAGGTSGAPQQPTTQTQTSTETRIETQRVNFQDSVPILRGLQAIGDERTNSVTLVGSPKQVDVATTQLTQLDSRRRQVAVNVKIVDVNLTAMDEANASFSFGIGNNFFQSSQGTATLNFGKTAQSNFGGFQGLQVHSNRFLSVLQASITNGDSKILTDPTLIVQEGQQANVNLTSEVIGNTTNQTNITSGAAIQTVTATKENVGLSLSIRIERIDDNGFVALSVAPIVRAPAGTTNIGVGTSSQQQITLVSERSLNSGVLRLRDNQTLILSGIIQDTDQSTVVKVPILGDIPILGALFRSTRKTNQRQEVIVLLTPQIIDDSVHSSIGYNYMPSPEVRQLLERRGSSVPKK